MTRSTVVVTGGTSGIGAGVSRAMAEAGWRVIAATVSQQEIDRFDSPGDVSTVLSDVTDGAAVTALFEGLDRLDGLVTQLGRFGQVDGILSPHRHDLI